MTQRELTAHIQNQGSNLFNTQPSKDWAGRVYSWPYENDVNALINVSSNDIKKALKALEIRYDH